MKKKIALIVLCLFVAVAIGLVIYLNPNVQKLKCSETQMQAISEACANYGIGPLNWNAENHAPGTVRYYGQYDNYDVFLLIPQDQTMRYGHICIGAYSFYLPFEGCRIYTHKDGKVGELEDLYAKGVFSDDIIQKILSQHVLYDNDGMKVGIMPA